MCCSSEKGPNWLMRSLNVTLTCPDCVQKVRVRLRKCLGENGRHVWTRTPDLYRVNFEVNNLKPFACLAFPQTSYPGMPQKWPIFGDELVTSFPASVERQQFRTTFPSSATGASHKTCTLICWSILQRSRVGIPYPFSRGSFSWLSRPRKPGDCHLPGRSLPLHQPRAKSARGQPLPKHCANILISPGLVLGGKGQSRSNGKPAEQCLLLRL